MSSRQTNFPPSQTNDTYDPNLRSVKPRSDEHEQRGEDPNRHKRPNLSSKAETTEDVWAQLEANQRKAQERKKIEDAAKKKQPMPITSSEPSLRSHQPPASNRRGQSSSSTESGSAQHDKKHNEKKGGFDPDFFEKLRKLNRKEISVSEINKPPPEAIPEPGPRVNGEWTSLHLLADRDPNRIPELIASGASLDALTQDGFTLLHKAVFRRNADAMRQLLAAGANPLACNEKQPSPLAYALVGRQELAMALAEALPANVKANVYEDGDTEVRMAVALPEVLYVLLSKGMKDSATANGVTALMSAAEDGKLQSVKYLLGHRPAGESASEFLDYLSIRSKANGQTALDQACLNNHDGVVELLLRHGARIENPPEGPSLLKQAVINKNTRMVQLLLDHGAAELEPNMVDLLFESVKHSQSEVVILLGRFVTLNSDQQSQLLKKWTYKFDCATLAAISHLIPQSMPSIAKMIKSQNFLSSTFNKGSPELLTAMLEFFDGRDSFHFVIQSFISQLIDDDGDILNADMSKAMLNFALPRFSRLSNDKETVMRLLQLSEQLKDYSIVTEIKEKNANRQRYTKKRIPFEPAWISDPVSRELLNVKKSQASSIFSNALGTVTSLMTPSSHSDQIDGAQLSNDLIFALKSHSVDSALDEVFDTHRISAITRQALKPVLQGLITQLHPDPATRTDAICRYLIAYALSSLEDNPRFTQHPGHGLMQTHSQWASMQVRVDAEIEVFDQVAVTILGTMASTQLSQTLPDQAVQLVLQSLNRTDAENFLYQAFQSLGALEVPARRLARACTAAAKNWRDQGGIIPSSGALPESEQLRFKTLISHELAALRRQASLPDSMSNTVMNVQSDLNPELHQMLWWQWDLIHQAFDIDTTKNMADTSGSEYLSDDSEYVKKREKS